MLKESEMVRMAQAGSEQAFESLVTAYERKIYTLAYRYTGNEQDALDICQEVFIRVYRSISGFKEESAFSTWIYRIASNICIDYSRKKQGKGTVPLYFQGEDGEEMAMEIPDPAEGPEAALDRRELRGDIERALSYLTEEHRQIVLLRDISGLSYGEIGEALAMPEGTVKSRLARARLNLRKILLSWGTIGGESRLTKAKGGAAHESVHG